jgi:hypothetical protein
LVLENIKPYYNLNVTLTIAALVMVMCRTITDTIPYGHTRWMQERDRVLIEEALHGMDLGLVPNNVAHWIGVLRDGGTLDLHQGLCMASFTAEVYLPRMELVIHYVPDNGHRWLMDVQQVVLDILVHAGYNVREREPYVVVEEA